MKTGALNELSQILNKISMVLLGCATLAVLAYTILCAVGVLPWLNFTATFGQTTFAGAGKVVQIGVAVVMTMFASFIPAAARVSILENSHRKFHLKMHDVAHAYAHCHAADRSGVFELSSEFDEVRERLAYMRDHPELGSLEPDVLEVAAQMSQVSQEIATVYSDENIGRAKLFLRQRREEIQAQKVQVAAARRAYEEIAQWAGELNGAAHSVSSEQADIEDKLRTILPTLGLNVVAHSGNVHPMGTRVPAE